MAKQRGSTERNSGNNREESKTNNQAGGEYNKEDKRSPGRPTKYDPSYCEKLTKFFDRDPYREVEAVRYTKDGTPYTVREERTNKLPTIEDFVKEIGIHKDTFYEWVKQHKEFSDTFTHAQELRKWFLVDNALNRRYDSNFAKFVAVNITDFRDKQEHDHKVKRIKVTVGGKEV